MSGPQYTYGRSHYPLPPKPDRGEDDEHWTDEAIQARNAKLREVNGKLNAEFAKKFPAVWGERVGRDL